MDRIGRWWMPRSSASPVDQLAFRDEMTREDPELARVRDIQHDALNALAAKRAADGLAIRREREFWQQRHGQGQ